MENLLEQLDAEIMSTDFDVSLVQPYVERWLRKCHEREEEIAAEQASDEDEDE